MGLGRKSKLMEDVSDTHAEQHMDDVILQLKEVSATLSAAADRLSATAERLEEQSNQNP